jgi:hypothetical protein
LLCNQGLNSNRVCILEENSIAVLFKAHDILYKRLISNCAVIFKHFSLFPMYCNLNFKFYLWKDISALPKITSK